jgi:hypothetical protein
LKNFFKKIQKRGYIISESPDNKSVKQKKSKETLYRGAGCTGNYKEVDSRASRTEAAVTYLYIS